MRRVLFDSGALSSSYMRKSFVDRHRDELDLAGCILPVTSSVTLGDNVTEMDITEVVLCKIVLRDSRGQPYHLVSRFAVIPTGPDIIVGLPDIISQVLDLFIDMLVSEDPQAVVLAHASPLLQNIYGGSEEICYPSDPADLRTGFPYSPWSKQPEECPEEIETPQITLFPHDFLASMESTRAEQIEEYVAMLDAHFDVDFLKSPLYPEFRQFMILVAVDSFVPSNWDGIRGIPLVEFSFRSDMPDHFSAHCRAVHPARAEAVRKELQRLIDLGILVPNPRAPYVSAIVDADKATFPFVRICGAYDREANKHIVPEQAFIPSVIRELEKFRGFKFFIDIDLTHSFRQFLLGPKTSSYLSIVTKDFGVLRPRFMPEGVTPATAVLQTYLREIFHDFSDWLVNIFDNFTICCDSYEDGFSKFKTFIARCQQHNLFLQFKKTWILMREVSFFGYVCNGEGYRLADSRKEAVMALPFPDGATKKAKRKAAQSMQGFLQYFRDFVPDFSRLSAPLSDMTQENFDWDAATWTLDYPQAILELKQACVDSMISYFPDLSLPWYLIPDASERAVGAILVQVRVSEVADTPPRHELIGCVSQKLSGPATRWDTIKRECYAIYFGITRLGYFLRHRPFVVLTDHANLQWLESSTVAIIVRWRLIMSGFPILAIKHIPGKKNPADYLTRDGAPVVSPLELFAPAAQLQALCGLATLLSITDHVSQPVHDLSSEPVMAAQQLQQPTTQYDQWISMLKQVHGGGSLHWGVAETWRRVQEHFPGSDMPYKFVVEYVLSCAICQKYRLSSPRNRLAPIIRTLKAPGPRERTSVDVLEISPPAEDLSRYIYVMTNICTGLAFGRVTKTKTAEDAADSMAIYISIYGITTTWVSDPGSDFTSETMQRLAEYFGTRYSFTLVDRPEANGVEPVNKQVLRHLRALVADRRLVHAWSKPSILAVIFAAINSSTKSEHGIDPFTATFGSLATPYFLRQESLTSGSHSLDNTYVKQLDLCISAAYEVIAETHASIIKKRTAPNHESPQNRFQPGDYVFVDIDGNRRNKLQAPKLGPYEVVSHVKNDVTVRDLHSGVIKPAYHITRISLFDGTRQEAMDLAMHDKDEYVIVSFRRFRGNPETRTTVEFEVLFSDGSCVWLPWNLSLFETVPYERFCQSDPMLTPLLYTAADFAKIRSALNKQPISAVRPGDTVFLNLRYYSHTWYKEEVPYDNKYDVAYLVPCRYGQLSHKRCRIQLLDDVFNANRPFVVNHQFVRYYGWCTNLAQYPGPYILVDKMFYDTHPELHDTRPQASHMVELPVDTDSPLFLLRRST